MAYGGASTLHAWQPSGPEDPRQTRYLIYEQRTETSTTPDNPRRPPSGPGGFQHAPVDRLGLLVRAWLASSFCFFWFFFFAFPI